MHCLGTHYITWGPEIIFGVSPHHVEGRFSKWFDVISLNHLQFLTMPNYPSVLVQFLLRFGPGLFQYSALLAHFLSGCWPVLVTFFRPS